MNAHQRALAIVRRVGEINLVGNITPHTWYKELTHDNGKPNLAAITILSEVVYWYRPVIEKDELTGRRLSIRKKFAHDKYETTYNNLAERFGLTRNQARSAVQYLKKRGLLTVEVRDRVVRRGIVYGNVLCLEVCPDALEQISHLPELDALDDTPSYSPVHEGHTLESPTLIDSSHQPSLFPDQDPHVLESMTLTKTPSETPPQIPSETSSNRAGEEGADLEDREGLARTLDQIGIDRAKAKLLAMPAPVVWAAIAAIPAHYDHRAACVVKEASRLHALYLQGQWSPPARPLVEVDTQPTPTITSTSPDPDVANPNGVLWQRALAQLREQVPPGEFETWIKETSLIQVAEQQAIVGTPNIFARDKLAETYAPLILEQLRAVGDVTQVVIVLDSQLAAGGRT